MRNYAKVRGHRDVREAYYFFDDDDPGSAAAARQWLEKHCKGLDRNASPPALRYVSVWDELPQWPDVQHVGEFRRHRFDPL